MKHKLKFTKRSSRLPGTKRRFCVDIRLVLMFLLMFHYAEPISRQGCYLDMETIRVKNKPNRVNILKPANGEVPVGDNVKNEGDLRQAECKTRCDNDKETCYLLVLDIHNRACYTGNKEATFHLDYNKSATVDSRSFINLCGHPVNDVADCYHTTTTTWVDSAILIHEGITSTSASECGLECDKEALCYGYYYHTDFKTCVFFKDDKTYSINLVKANIPKLQHKYGFKKCFACADEPCMNRGTCAHVSGTCCDYDCTCQGGTIGKHCENCNPGYGLESQVCKPCGIGLFNPAVGPVCKECTGAGVTTNSTGSKSCDACDVSFGKNGTINGHVTCKKCDGDTYSDTTDDSECKDCGSLMIPTNNHTYCVCKPGYQQGNLDCDPCAKGLFNPSKDSKCDKCPGAGVTTKSTGSKSCDACEVGFGKSGTENGHITCEKCKGMTQSSTIDDAQCTTCGSSDMVPAENNDKCVCKPGYEQGNPNCETCAKGSFNPSKGSTCEQCSLKGEGVTTKSTGSKICDACIAGYGKRGTKNGHITCEKCTGNTYSDKTDGSTCNDCGDGMRPTDDHKGCESVPTSTTVTSVTPSTGKTLSSSAQTPPTVKTLSSSTQTQPTGKTFESSAQTQPNAKTFESSTTTLAAGETLNNSTPSPPTGKTLNSSLTTLPTGKTINSSLPTPPTGNSFNSSTTQTLPTTKKLIMPAANPSKIPRGNTSKIMPKMIQWVLCLQLTLIQLQKLLQH